jgi:hypothetical protein
MLNRWIQRARKIGETAAACRGWSWPEGGNRSAQRMHGVQPVRRRESLRLRAAVFGALFVTSHGYVPLLRLPVTGEHGRDRKADCASCHKTEDAQNAGDHKLCPVTRPHA